MAAGGRVRRGPGCVRACATGCARQSPADARHHHRRPDRSADARPGGRRSRQRHRRCRAASRDDAGDRCRRRVRRLPDPRLVGHARALRRRPRPRRGEQGAASALCGARHHDRPRCVGRPSRPGAGVAARDRQRDALRAHAVELRPKDRGDRTGLERHARNGVGSGGRQALETLRRLDVDFVKITDSTLTPELFLYAVRKARAAGLKTSGHIPMALTVRQAVDAGISSIEHLDYAFKAGVKDEAAIAADFAAGRIDRAEANRASTRGSIARQR